MSTEKIFDICIVGSGITGSLVADHFLSKGLKVIMLERGNDIYLPDTPKECWHELWQQKPDNPNISSNYWHGAEKYFDDLVEIENVNREFAFFYNMKYGLGGSGAVWSAAAWRYTPEDFKTQSLFGYGRNWPFTYEELSPYYDRVEQIIFTAGPQNEASWPWKNNYKYPAFKQSYLDKVVKKAFSPEFDIVPTAFSVKNLPPIEGGCVGAKTCVEKCPANARFRPDLHILSKHFDNTDLVLLMGTPCLKINLAKNQAVESVSILKDGKPSEVKAKYYFLAANTIENLRILHNSADTVANSSGLLGHFFASHGVVAMSIILHDRLFVSRGRPTTSSAINTLNHKKRDKFNAYIMEIWNFDWGIGMTPHAILRNIRKRERHWGVSLFNKVKEADYRFAATLIFEMEMQQRNKVMLSNVKDKFGLPLAKVDFKLGERDELTFDTLKHKTVEMLRQKKGVKDINISGYGLNGNHPLGGYVCGDDPKNSVVDPFMRSHDHNNLYILGGGAFNSISALNPTHTIAALTLKALDDKRISF